MSGLPRPREVSGLLDDASPDGQGLEICLKIVCSFELVLLVASA